MIYIMPIKGGVIELSADSSDEPIIMRILPDPKERSPVIGINMLGEKIRGQATYSTRAGNIPCFRPHPSDCDWNKKGRKKGDK